VSAQTKRRRLSLYSLPVVVAIGFLVVAHLAAWQQSDIVADLSDRIAYGEAREANDAVHKLAAMPNPPVSVLVTAAAADEHETADAGQVAISKLLRRWQRDVERKQRVGTVASQLCELAEALDMQQRDFATSDREWLAITAGKILRLANTLPASKTPLVAIHCDAILAAVDAGGSIVVSGSVDDDRGNEPKSGSTKPAPAPITGNSNVQAESESGLNRESSLSSSQPVGGTPTSSEPPASIFNVEDDPLSASHGLPQADVTDHEGDEPSDGDFSAHEMPSPTRFNSSEWARPILRILPAKSGGLASAGEPLANGSEKENASESLSSVAQNQRPDLRSDLAQKGRLSAVDSKELLRRWRTAEGDDVQSIERELSRRGFGKITPELVQRFFSDQAQDRMRLVSDALAMPGGGAAAWLMLLADDRDAEVRLFAVTLMSTSNDASLVDKAWQVSLHDHDPRIADLAGRLRVRRTGTLRR
jgi:hypothetical protein